MNIFDEFYIPFLKDNIPYFIIYAIFSFGTYPFQTIILPKLYGMLIGKINSGDISTIQITLGNLYTSLLKFGLQGIILSIILVYIFISGAHAIKNYIEADLVPNFLTFAREKIFRKTVEERSKNFREVKSGEHISRILEVTRSMKNIFQWVMSDTIPETFALILTVLYFLTIDSEITYVLGFALIIIYTIIYITSEYVISGSREREIKYFELSEKLNDSFSNLLNVYLNNEEETENKKNEDVSKEYGTEYKNLLITERYIITACQTMAIIAYSTSVLKMLGKFTNNTLKASTFITSMLLLGNYMNYTFSSIYNIGAVLLSQIGIISASDPFLSEIMNASSTKGITSGIDSGEIYFNDIVYAYDKTGSNLFDGFNLHIDGGDKVAIVGPSGSGKTTLTKMLVGVIRPTHGNIKIDGTLIEEYDTTYLRDKVIYVNQRTTLFDTTILENIKYGNHNVSDDEVMNIIEEYRLQSVYGELEQGVSSHAGSNGSNLSLGMQKVTIILRSIFKDGQVYIFDEPLAGLDGNTRKKVMRLLLNKCKDKTLLVITHDEEIIPFMNRVIDLKEYKDKND
jgi:ABC-type multidrug transport system fused ATPase/permease subunit|uniref:ABC transporter domain-containing protein n=1 Tax=viral metagenome TaxID=1070528 RepID=A0A6C0JA14_9ZZZZ